MSSASGGWFASLLAMAVRMSVRRANLWFGVVRAPLSPHRKLIWNSVLNNSSRVGSKTGPKEDISCTTVLAFRLNMSIWLGKCRAASKWAAVALKSNSRLFIRLNENVSSGCKRPPPSPSVSRR